MRGIRFLIQVDTCKPVDISIDSKQLKYPRELK